MARSSVLHCRDCEPQITRILNPIDRTATRARAADTALVVGMKCRFVIDRDLFARFDVAQRNEENVIVKNLHEGVGPTGVVDVVSTVSTAASVEAPVIVHFTNAQHSPVSPAPGFGV